VTRRDQLILAVGMAFRGLFPLVVLARSPGRVLPPFPRYHYDPLGGDAYGYYFAMREAIAAWQRDAAVLGPLVLVAVGAVVFTWRRARRSAPRVAVIVAACGALAAAVAGLVRFSGAAQFGWSLLWSIPVLPLRAAGVEITPGRAFAVALALSLICNCVTVVATFVLAFEITRSRAVARTASLLFAFWPVIVLLAGARGARNGTWQLDLGLSLYTEPLSTALVTVALALLVRRRLEPAWVIGTGALLGFATLVRLSNVLIAGCAVGALLLWGRRREAAELAYGAAAFVPATALFWPKGYPKLQPPTFPRHPFQWSYAEVAWSHSLLWRPAVLLALVPIAVLGSVRVDRRVLPLLAGCVAATATLYTFYKLTPLHPRFLFVVLPAVLCFWAAGASVVAVAIRHLYHRSA
jgi:hypothetical protein